MQRNNFRLAACLAVLLLAVPAARADNVTLESNKAKASFSFSGGKFHFVNDFQDGESNHKHYEGTIRPGETVKLSLKALGGYGEDEGIGGNQAFITVSVVRKGSRYWEETPANKSADVDRSVLPSLSTSYTVPEDAEAVSICLGFMSTGGIDWAPMSGGVNVFLDYKVDQNAAAAPKKEAGSSIFGKKKPASSEDEESDDPHFEEDNEAFGFDGFWDYGIPVAVIAAITGVVVHRHRKKKRGARTLEGDEGDSEEDDGGEEPQPVRYAMRMYKQFSDTLIPGDSPQQVYAQIVRIPAQGDEVPEPALTSALSVTGDGYLQVSPHAGLQDGWKAADVSAPQADPVPAEGVVTFRLAGGQGSYTNHVHFKIKQEEPEIVFQQDEVTFIAGENQSMNMAFRVFGMGDDLLFDVRMEGYTSESIEVSEVRTDEAGAWCLDIRDKGRGEDVAGQMDTYSCVVTAKAQTPSGERKLEGRFYVHRFYEGIRVDVGHLKAYPVVRGTNNILLEEQLPKDYSEELAPAHTRMIVTLFAWDREDGKLKRPIPRAYKISIEDIPGSAVVYDLDGNPVENPVRGLGFKPEECNKSSEPDPDGATVFDVFPQTILVPPARTKAKITVRTEYKGQSYVAERTVMVISTPCRDSQQQEAAKAADEEITDKLRMMQAQLLSQPTAELMEPLIAKIGLMLDSYDKRFGYWLPDYAKAASLFLRFTTGEIGSMYVNESVFNWNEVIIKDTFDMTVADLQNSVLDKFVVRLSLGILSGMASEVVFYMPKDFLVECRDYAVTHDNPSTWECFQVGAVIGARDYLLYEGGKYAFGKVGKWLQGDSMVAQGLREMAGEFKTSMVNTSRMLSERYSAYNYAMRFGNAVRKVANMEVKFGADGMKKLLAGKEAVAKSAKLQHLAAIEAEAQEEAQTMVKEFVNACNSETIAETELRDLVVTMNQNRFVKNALNSPKIPTKYKYRFVSENTIINEHTKIAVRKKIARSYGVPESNVTYFNATGNKQGNAFTTKKVGMDYDYTVKVNGVEVPDHIAAEYWNEEYYKLAKGHAPATRAEADILAHDAEHTAVSYNSADSFRGDLKNVLDPDLAKNPLNDAAHVLKVQTTKVVEYLVEGEKLAQEALTPGISLPRSKELLKKSLSCFCEAGRQLPKGINRTIQPKLKVIEAMGKGGMLDVSKVTSAFELSGRINAAMNRTVSGDPTAIVELMGSFEIEGKNLAAEAKKVFSLITDMDNIIRYH